MKTFKLALAGTALVGALATSAMAGECSFSGFYLGGQLGAGTTNTDVKQSTIPVRSKFAATGVIGGLHAGYGKHFPNRFYIGLEAYGNLSGNKGSHDVGNRNWKSQRNNSFGLALRPGVVFGNALVYAKIGIESANFKYSLSDGAHATLKANNSSRRTGFVPGLGVAFHATDHVIVGVEATHTFYNSRNLATPAVAAPAIAARTYKMQSQATDFFARVSYKW